MADYRDRYEEIRAAGADVAAISVDAPEQSEAVRRELQLPFPILCDTGRRLVREWDLYNPREHGGIAKPAIFVVDRDRKVRFADVNSVGRRVFAQAMIQVLRTPGESRAAQRTAYFPRVGEWVRAIRNMLRH